MIFEYTLKTERENFYNITAKVKDAVSQSGITDGLCVVFCPHTTAGITINENADPDVVHDMLIGLNTIFHLKYRQTSLSISAAISDRAKENSIY